MMLWMKTNNNNKKVTFLRSQEKVPCMQQFVFLEGPFRMLQVSDKSSELDYDITKTISNR